MNRRRERIPRTVWMLGGVSLFMDMSSELVRAILPVYLTAVLGLSVLTVGIIEGIAEATASMVALVAATSALAWLPGTPGLWLGVGLWGLRMGLSQGALSAAAAQFAPIELRATAFGLFHFVTGVFQLLSGASAGWLEDAVSCFDTSVSLY